VIPVQLCLIAALAGVIAPTAALPHDLAPKPQPSVSYVLRIIPGDSLPIDVTMHVENAPANVRVAMAVHPEYDDRFWRYVRDMRADAGGAQLPIRQESENSWLVSTSRGAATVHYRIRLPGENPVNRGAWRTIVRADGASLNSTDTFLYLPDFPRSPVSVTFNIPESWDLRAELTGGRLADAIITTGTLGRANSQNPHSISSDATTLLDSPILLGTLRTWSFAVQGVPHRIVYWPLPNATPFDTAQFVEAS
jgi:predicted metalloprotease with PDZ domain